MADSVKSGITAKNVAIVGGVAAILYGLLGGKPKPTAMAGAPRKRRACNGCGR